MVRVATTPLANFPSIVLASERHPVVTHFASMGVVIWNETLPKLPRFGKHDIPKSSGFGKASTSKPPRFGKTSGSISD